jgi:hypothetical protein
MKDLKEHLLTRVFPYLALTLTQRAELADIALGMVRDNYKAPEYKGYITPEKPNINLNISVMELIKREFLDMTPQATKRAG